MHLILLLLTILVFVSSSESGNFYNVNGTSFYVSYPSMLRNWYQAQRYCTLHGMYLATIHTEHQYNATLDVIERHQIPQKHVHFWTSGTDLGHAYREYYWTTSGFPFTFTNWMGGHPVTTHSTKLCVLLNGASSVKYQWHDYDCESLQYFICQSNLELPPTRKYESCQD